MKKAISHLFDKRLLACSLLLFWWMGIKAQDLHFSQFSSTPSYINPALTGKFNGDGRITLNQRSQWKSVTVPYQTFAATADFSRMGSSPNLGSGVSFYYDKAGDSKLTTLKFDFALSYRLKLSYDNKHSLSMGLQGGLKNMSIDYTALRFDNQYNGTAYDPNLANGESFTYQKILSATASAGLAYFYVDHKKVIIGGIGVYNLIASNQSFFSTGYSPLDKRVNSYVGAEIALNDKQILIPTLFYSQQGILRETILGGKLKHILVDQNNVYQALSGGVFFRNRDAVFVTANFEVNDFNFGLSYDLNVSKLRKASSFRGAYEVALIYVYRGKQSSGSRKFSSCPVFI